MSKCELRTNTFGSRHNAVSPTMATVRFSHNNIHACMNGTRQKNPTGRARIGARHVAAGCRPTYHPAASCVSSRVYRFASRSIAHIFFRATSTYPTIFYRHKSSGRQQPLAIFWWTQIMGYSMSGGDCSQPPRVLRVRTRALPRTMPTLAGTIKVVSLQLSAFS